MLLIDCVSFNWALFRFGAALKIVNPIRIYSAFGLFVVKKQNQSKHVSMRVFKEYLTNCFNQRSDQVATGFSFETG